MRRAQDAIARRGMNLSIAELDRLMDRAYSGAATGAGVPVSAEGALRLIPVFACVRVLAESVGSLPCITYRRQADGGRERATSHPLYDLLHDAPNPEQTAMEFWELCMTHLSLYGNFYAEIERNPYGAVALWPLRPDRMQVGRDANDDLVYAYRGPDGMQRLFSFVDIFHVRGLSLDGVLGVSPIAYAREAIGLGLAAEGFGARFFGNDSRPGGVLQHPGRLTPEAADRLKASWESLHRGIENRWRVAVLEEGLTWQAIGVPPEDAQFLQTRQYQTQEIARLFRVPPHLIQDLDRATWGNIEHQAIDFVTHTIRPWLVRIEQALLRDVFRVTAGKRSHYAEFLVDGLLRGDALARANALAVQRQNGIITANEWREIENRNRIAGGDLLLVNGSMIPAPAEGAAPDGKAAADEFSARANAVGILIRSGFEADAALAAAGLPPIAHTGLLPVTLQSEHKAQAGADGSPPDAPGGHDGTTIP